eukprot:CAMPEP_0197681020 /NCGR_PEP_ID=MMETSP1338-20131121/94223_1 /TAXON_ID=43686 ORGANISM="Pelagodinium beii, Strain RCC1491" /NCGR_SAMPLE_ID=MMETSP1338 /ASSEMBLY_ACC=CAM_ASM_000754 /LENGTH=674 /DNA_ID=CAMNT_0043262277 /DNA_START=80 /DNA_END=2104 /DNA_ORIENTATION=-
MAMVRESSQDWEIVQPTKPAWDSELYDQIESNKLLPCQVRIGDKALSFCLEPKTGLDAEAGRLAAILSDNCRTCMHRIPKFAQFLGAQGKHAAFCQEVSDPRLDEIRRMRAGCGTSKNANDYKLIVIDAEFMAKYPVTVGPFEHVHFSCDQLSPDDLAAKLKELLPYLNGSFENRFQRLIDDPSSLEIIEKAIPSLARPDHWRSVTSWALEFVAKAKGQRWAELAAHAKFEIMIFAMLTGRSHGSIHLDMQQAANLVDFMDDAHNAAALRAMMDDRSNPETYQVSRVAALLRDKCVTSSCTVTLTWGGEGQPNKSDLDLHTKVNGQELYYGNKQVGKCKLDFDANASKVEKNPAENISLNQVGTFEFRVNNFLNRDGKDVPFEVTVRKPGFNEVHAGLWPSKRKAGNFIHICTVTVSKKDLEEKPVELSEAEQKKLSNKEAEWERLFGEPKSTVASSKDLDLCLVQRGVQGKFSPPKRGAQEIFSQLLAKPTPQKSSLAERCQLETLSGLIKYVTSTTCTLEVNPRNFVPAYVTRLETKTDVLGRNHPINVYHRKNEPPQQPRADEPSTVRFDGCWGLSSRASVHGFVQVQGTWFMVLQGAKLPRDPSWPLGAGMYPTHLTPELHHHRSKWTSFHTLVTPRIPDSGVPLIGSALVGFPTYQFLLNGREISVRCD